MNNITKPEGHKYQAKQEASKGSQSDYCKCHFTLSTIFFLGYAWSNTHNPCE